MDPKFLALVVAVVVALAVPTAAVTGGDDDAGPIALSPHDGPNGEYATVEDGELAVAFEALNDEAETTAHDVFTVTATADEPVAVWVEVDGVAVYVGADPGARIDRAGEAVTLQPGETVSVGLRIDARGAVPDPDAMTVHVERPDGNASGDGSTATTDGSPGRPSFEVVDVSATAEGATATVAVTVENDGDARGAYTAELLVDGVVVDSRTVRLAAGERTTVTFERAFGEPGEYHVGVGGAAASTTVTVGGSGAAFEVVGLRVGDRSLPAGEATTVAATVENVGDARGAYTAELLVDGRPLARQTVTLAAGERTTVTFERAFGEPGEYQVAVGDERATVTVAPGVTYEVTDVRVDRRELRAGEATAVVATVENVGDVGGAVEVNLTVAGVEVETASVEVPAGESRAVEFDRRFREPGVYPVAVDGVEGGDVVVRAGDDRRVLASSLRATVVLPVLVGLLLALRRW